MSTVNLNIYTAAYPSITNDIAINIYLQSDPLAIIATVRYAAPHGFHTWSFPGLVRSNYLFRIFEMAGSSVVQQLGDDMDVVPGSAGDVLFKATEQIEVDVTTGLTAGANTFTFDGTGGKQDWRGWEIDTIDRMGTGPMKKGIDYSWDSTTGLFTLLVAGDLFSHLEWFNVSFAAESVGGGDSVPVGSDSVIARLVKVNYTLDPGTDFGATLIIDPAGNYIELQLPDITTVAAGRVVTFEMRRAATNKCAKIITFGTDPIDWLLGARTDLFICPNESISLYKFIDPAGPTSMWRTAKPFGNFLKVGEQISDDNILANVFNKVLMDGADGDIQIFARFYNDYILNLDPAQVVNYDDWATGSNKYKFSLANSSVSGNAGKFKIADRRNAFERNTNGTRVPGDFQAQDLMPHDHIMHGQGPIPGAGGPYFMTITTNRYSAGGGSDTLGGKTGTPDNTMRTSLTTGSETRPANYAVRKYLLV